MEKIEIEGILLVDPFNKLIGIGNRNFNLLKTEELQALEGKQVRLTLEVLE